MDQGNGWRSKQDHFCNSTNMLEQAWDASAWKPQKFIYIINIIAQNLNTYTLIIYIQLGSGWICNFWYAQIPKEKKEKIQ